MKTITNRQIVFILFLSTMAISIVKMPRIMSDVAGSSAWVFILGYSIIFAITYSMMVYLNVRFEGLTLYEYGKQLVGKFLLVIIVAVLFIYGFGRVAVMGRNISAVINIAFLPRTPIYAIMFMLFLASGFLAFKGNLTVGRIFEIYGIVEAVFLVIIIIFLFIQGNYVYSEPLLDKELIKKGFAKSSTVLNTFNGAEVLFLLPLSKKINGKKAYIITFFTVIMLAIFFSAILETSIMMIGPNAITHFENPLIVAIRRINIDIFPFLSRMDIFFITIGLSGFYCALSIAILLIVEILCKVFKRINRIIIVIVTVSSLLIAGLLIPNNKVLQSLSNIINNYGTIIVCVLLPIILFIIAKVKNNVDTKSIKN